MYTIRRAVEDRYNACRTCGAVVDRWVFNYEIPAHCGQCGGHYRAAMPSLDVCPSCGWKRYPDAHVQPPDPAAAPPVQQPVGPFYSKDEFRRPNGTGNIDPDDFVRALGGAASVAPAPGSSRVELLRDSARHVTSISVQGLANTKDAALRADVRESLENLREWIRHVEAAAPWLSEEGAS